MNTELQPRIDEALKIMRGLNSMNINKDTCPDIIRFSVVLNDWVKTGESQQGKIKLPEIDKKLVYQLMIPNKNTMVKLTDM